MSILGPSIFRYLAAIVYDLFILISLWLFAMALLVFLETRGFVFSTTVHGLILLLLAYLLYVWCWIRSGQTLGARAWHIHVVDCNGALLSWKQASLRFAVTWLSFCLLGFGQIWLFFDPERQTMVDRLTKTRLRFSLDPNE